MSWATWQVEPDEATILPLHNALNLSRMRVAQYPGYYKNTIV